MSALPIPPLRDPAPDYIPARMVNEFVYCPRLFFYEWVEGVFRESADTLEGSAQHKRVDARASELPIAGESEEKIHARSVTLSSERLRVIAKLDLVEAEGMAATPVDYKHGLRVKGKTESRCGPRTGSNSPCKQWCCAKTGMNAMRRSCSIRRRDSGCGFR